MSLIITDVVSWKYNDQTGCIEFSAKSSAGTDVTFVVPETKFSEIIDIIPSLEEEKKLKKLLDTLYEIRNRRLLAIDEVAKLIDDMRKKHEDLRTRLTAKGVDKITIIALTAESKDLGTEKVLLDTKRHLIALLIREEGRIRADIAKMQAMKGL